VLAVQVKNEGTNSGLYNGSGIYHNVTLLKINPLHIALWGTYITSPWVNSDNAIVNLVARLANPSHEKGSLKLKTKILDPNRKLLAESESPAHLQEDGPAPIQTEQKVENPELWLTENPVLYTIKSIRPQGRALGPSFRGKAPRN
jgi:beta-galactosidase